MASSDGIPWIFDLTTTFWLLITNLFFIDSLKAIKSIGEWAGTLITIPVPIASLTIELGIIGMNSLVIGLNTSFLIKVLDVIDSTIVKSLKIALILWILLVETI